MGEEKRNRRTSTFSLSRREDLSTSLTLSWSTYLSKSVWSLNVAVFPKRIILAAFWVMNRTKEVGRGGGGGRLQKSILNLGIFSWSGRGKKLSFNEILSMTNCTQLLLAACPVSIPPFFFTNRGLLWEGVYMCPSKILTFSVTGGPVTQVWPMKCKWKWDRLGPGTVYSSNKIQRNCKGLKITACVCIRAVMKNKLQKGHQLPFLRCWEQKQGPVHDPCTRHHQGGMQTT